MSETTEVKRKFLVQVEVTLFDQGGGESLTPQDACDVVRAGMQALCSDGYEDEGDRVGIYSFEILSSGKGGS